MKRRLYPVMAALMVVLAVSCNKDDKTGNGPDSGKYGIDGVTPMPEAVDIGLEVDGRHVLWASFNLGASKEWENGDYYSWGETETYYSSLNPLSWKKGKEQGYDCPSYRFANGAFYKITKYCMETDTGNWDGEGSVPDNLTELLPEDDAANVKLGGKWKIPTKRMFEALLALKDNPDYIWDQWAEMKNDKGETVHGLRITRMSTGKYVFFPATGFSRKTEMCRSVGEFGEYWTSSLDTGMPEDFLAPPPEASHAFYMYSNEATSGYSTTLRYEGITIRPVYVE